MALRKASRMTNLKDSNNVTKKAWEEFIKKPR